jgi:DNA-binding NarL/FixJ family response regulator
VNLSDGLDQAGRTDESIGVALEGVQFSRERGFGNSYAIFLAAEAADRMIRLGRWDGAAELLDDGLARHTSGVTLAHALEERAQLDLRLGDFEIADRRLKEAMGVHRGKPGSMWIGPIFASAAELAVWRGEPEEAWAAFERYLDTLGDEQEYGFYILRLYAAAVRAQADLAERARALGDEEAARLAQARAEQALARAETVNENGSPGTAAYQDLCRAEASRAAASTDPGPWSAAIDSFEAMSYPFFAALCRQRRAEVLLAAGDRAAATADLADARAVAASLGAKPLLAEIESLARRARLDVDVAPVEAAAGNGLPADDMASQLGLTAREMDVLRLVAEGLTNREIAARLYISDKTASVHVSRILAKLDVRSRVEAAGVAHRLGIAD